MEKKKIYISGPISGTDYEQTKQLFFKAQSIMEGMGYDVWNPICNGVPKDAPSFEHMKVDLQKLTECNEICMLPRWNHSAGCLNEFMVAVSSGFEVTFIQNFEPLAIVRTKFI